MLRLTDRVLNFGQRQTLKAIAYGGVWCKRLPFANGNAVQLFYAGKPLSSLRSLSKRRWVRINRRKWPWIAELTPRGDLALAQLLLEEWTWP